MKINTWKENKLFIFGFSIFALTIILFISYLSKNLTFIGDDFGYSIGDTICEAFTRDTHGRGYIGFFLNQFFSFNLPILLNIHPGDFTGSIQGYIKGILTVITLLVISNFSTFFNRNKKIHFSFFLITTLFFFTAITITQSYILEVNYNFYRYFFSILFFSIFWGFIYKHILTKYKKTNYPQLIWVSLCGFIVGTSIEISFFASIFLGILLFTYNILIECFYKLKKNNNIKNLKLNLDKNFYYPILSLATGIIFFTSQSGYKDVARDRGMEQISISLDIIKDFLTYFCKICFNFEAIYWLLFIPSLIICLYTAKKRNEIKKFVFPILYVFALLTTLFSLILCGKTNVDMSIPAFELGGYWITHNNIIFLYKMLLLIPLFICLSYIFRKSKIKTILISSFIFILILTSTIKEETFQYIIYKANNNIKAKQGNYIVEKIMRFFYLNNEEIQLQKLYKNAKTLHYAEDPNLYINTYIRRIYKDMDTKKITYTLTDNAVKEFIQKGGSISKTELENIKFQNLYTTNIQDLKKVSNDNLSEEEIIDLLEN